MRKAPSWGLVVSQKVATFFNPIRYDAVRLFNHVLVFVSHPQHFQNCPIFKNRKDGVEGLVNFFQITGDYIDELDSGVAHFAFLPMFGLAVALPDENYSMVIF